MTARALAGAVIAALVLLPGAAHADDERGRVAVTITDPRVTESSGLVQSTTDPALVYTVNDSGNAAEVFVVDLATGDVVATTTLDVELVDAEAMTVGADDRLYVADVGDNSGVRRRVDLWALPQPGRADATVSPQRYRVRYDDGPRDAEAIVSDVLDGSFYLVGKGLFGGDLYRLDPLRTGRATVAREVEATIPGLVTGADVVRRRSAVLLRTYSDLHVLAFPGFETLDVVELPDQPQGETLAVIDGGPVVYVGTEGSPSDLIRVRVPREVWRELGRRATDRDAEPEPGADEAPAAQDADDAESWLWLAGGGLVVALLLLLLVAELRGRLPRR